MTKTAQTKKKTTSAASKTRAQLDLAALNNKQGELTLPDGSVVYFESPDVEDLLALSEIGDGLEAIQDNDDPDPQEVKEALAAFREKIVQFIPQLEGVKLNLPQQMAVLDLLLEMAMPEDDGTNPPKGQPRDHLPKKKPAPKTKSTTKGK